MSNQFLGPLLSLLLCFSPLAYAGDMYGMFMVVKGEVFVINAQNQKNPVKVGSKILPGETVVSGKDSRAKIVMSDRNVMNISPETTLKIEQYTNDAKTGEKNVQLNLIDGKARNNVEQKYDGEKSKFIMKTATAVAGVRGTQFFVAYNARSQMTQVVTLKGQVAFAPVSIDGSVGQPVMVNKGQATSVAAGAAAPEPPKTLPKEELNKVDRETTAATNSPPKDSAPAADKKTAEQKKEDGKPEDGTKNSPSGDGAATPQQQANNQNPKDPSGKEPGPKDGPPPKDGAPAPKDSASGPPPKEGGVAKDGNPAKGPAPRSPAAVNDPAAGAMPPPGPKMVDRRDMDMGLVNEIKPPMAGPVVAQPPPMMNMPPPLAPPPPPPALGDIIKNYNGTTKVIIVPQ